MNNPNREIDIDDEFLSRKPKGYILEEKKAKDLTEVTNKRLQNTRQILLETEQIGQSTLENLSIQREGLERAEDNLDHINATARATQKHLNNLGSFFGGFKSFFSKKDPNAAVSPALAANGSMPRSKTMASVPSDIPAGASSSSSSNPSNNISSRPSFAVPAPVQLDSSEDKDEFEANLSAIGFGLGTLKDMATRLGDEISDQNEMLDRITDKSERAGDTIKHQNRQMQQLLKKG